MKRGMQRGGTPTAEPPRFIGCVDVAEPTVIAGWVADTRPGSAAPLVQLELDGLVAGSQRSDAPRPDLALEGLDTTRLGFRFELAEPLHAETTVDVRLVEHGDAVVWPQPRAYPGAAVREEHAPQAHAAPKLTPGQRETMVTLALHREEAAAAMAEWPTAPPKGETADGLLLDLMMRVAALPKAR